MNLSGTHRRHTTRLARRHGADQGFTLVELIVTIGMLGLVAAVISVAIVVILRSENGVVQITAESHDTQQGVNYFPLDIQAGPTQVAAYDTGPAATGCVGGGTNLLQFDKGKRRVAYRITVSGAIAILDRQTCIDESAVPPSVWGSVEHVNIADNLDASVGAPAIVQVTPQTSKPSVVQSIQLVLDQVGGYSTIVGSPRAEPRDSPGDCSTTNPLAASHGFGTFIEGDVLLQTGTVSGWLALGGTLRWESSVSVASGNMSGVNPAYGLYAGNVDWVGNGLPGAEQLEVKRGKAALGTTFFKTGDFVYQVNGSPDNYLNLSGPSNPAAEPAAGQISFTDDFDELRDCSAALARLLDLCAAASCANEVTATVTGTTINVCSSSPIPQVLNIPETYFNGTYSLNAAGPGCQGFSQSRPLILNVIDTNGDDEVIINPVTVDWTSLGDRKNILVNFPDSTHVIVQTNFFGELFAPFAHVETTGNFFGGLIAAQWTHHSGTVTSHTDLFNNPITWP